MNLAVGANDMNDRHNPRRCEFVCRDVLFGGLLAFASGAQAQAGLDLVAHHGFEVCWSRSVDATSLAAQIVDSIDGAPGCVPASTGGGTQFCYTTTCAGNVPGCPTVLRGGQAAYAAGSDRFDVQSGLDSIFGKVTLPLIGECDFSINTSNVTQSYSINYQNLVTDGNNGYYPTVLSANNVFSTGLTAADWTLTGGISCSLANLGAGFFQDVLAEVSPSIEVAVLSTLDHPWCPYPF